MRLFEWCRCGGIVINAVKRTKAFREEMSWSKKNIFGVDVGDVQGESGYLQLTPRCI